MVSYSYSGGGGIDADNWMITDKLKKGSEILKFSAYAPFPEDVEVYVVPAPASGSAPTLDEVKAGHKVLDQRFENENFEDVTVNIKSKTSSDFFLAFYHKTKKEADAWYLAVDDITLGYDNSLPATGGASKNAKKLWNS
ncbi:choice-of-anchor J domain-containing protein [Kaistella anthropi]|nr:choice-of-anchor J domain-containing protein [Kaistella anthropi]